VSVASRAAGLSGEACFFTDHTKRRKEKKEDRPNIFKLKS
jgi:hypothetical protein